MKLQEITTGLSLSGVEPTQIVNVVTTVPLGDGEVQLIYRTPDGQIKERLLSRADETSINVATVERPFSFDGDGAAFQLACEAKRIDLAFLFDPMMAVHTSNVEPRDVFREATLGGAAAIVVFHNHPSGDPSPSEDDVDLTHRLVAAGVLMGIDVVDHIVLGDVRYCSFKESGRL